MRVRIPLAVVAGLMITAAGASYAQSPSGAAAFDARAAKHRGGVFFTSTDIQKRGPARLSDLFRNLSGVALSTGDNGKTVLTSSRGTRIGMNPGAAGVAGATTPSGPGEGMASPTVTGSHCSVLVGVDGQMMDPSFSVDDVPVNSVHGIELYTGSSRIPVEFGAANNSGCGVVMIWSKTGADHTP